MQALASLSNLQELACEAIYIEFLDEGPFFVNEFDLAQIKNTPFSPFTGGLIKFDFSQGILAQSDILIKGSEKSTKLEISSPFQVISPKSLTLNKLRIFFVDQEQSAFNDQQQSITIFESGSGSKIILTNCFLSLKPSNIDGKDFTLFNIPENQQTEGLSSFSVMNSSIEYFH